MRRANQSKMNRTKLLQRLRGDGYIVGSQVLRYAIDIGAVSVPPRDALSRSVYGERHYRQFLAYLQARRKPNARAVKKALAGQAQ